MARESRNNNKHRMIRAKDIMRKYGMSYQTINHYTDFGLLPVELKRGNVRLYDGDVVGVRMRKIRKLMGEGYSLRLIRKKLIGI